MTNGFGYFIYEVGSPAQQKLTKMFQLLLIHVALTARWLEWLEVIEVLNLTDSASYI